MGTSGHTGNRPSPRVDVVIPSFNARALLQRCLTRLAEQTQLHRVIVVDNGSIDASAAMVRAQFPDALLITHPRNLGFAAGCNAGIELALSQNADYVALLNQDTEPEPSWLSALVEAAEADATVAAVGSRILLASHRTVLNSAGIEVNALGQAWDRGFGRADGSQWHQHTEILGASGGALLLRASALREVGLLDPDYFAYYEDLDLCVRLREAGYRIVFAPAATVFHRAWHVFGAPSADREVLVRANRWRFFLKHFPLRLAHATIPLSACKRALGRSWQRGLGSLVIDRRIAVHLLRGAGSIARYRGGRSDSSTRARWWHFVLPASAIAPSFVPYIDYDITQDESAATGARVLMGVSDSVLGEGWYPLSAASPTEPALRWMARTAACYLRVAHAGHHILQLHIRRPIDSAAPRLDVRCNGKHAASVQIEPATSNDTWLTLQLPVYLDRASATVELYVEPTHVRERADGACDLGLGFNEVSILPPGSPFLRASLRRAASANACAAGQP